MSTPTEPSSPQTDVAYIERGRLLHALRNNALAALETGWRLDAPPPPPRGRFARLRHLFQSRLLWPLLYPLIERQQNQNAALIRALYATAEQSDYLGLVGNQLTLSTQQLRDAIAHVNLRIDHTQEGVAELNERTLRERHLLAQQLKDFAEQLAALEEAEQQLRAILRGEAPPLPRTLTAPEAA